MYGIIFLVISILAFAGLYMYIKKSDNGNSENNTNRKELMNELYNKTPKNKKQENKKTSETQLEDNKNIDENNNDENTDDENKEDEYEEYTYDSYKSDEEYLRIARLMKNIYFTIVAVVIMVLGILYIMLFKLS